MSILGVSIIENNVISAMGEGSRNFYIMEELHDEAGRLAASYVQTESALMTNSASSGIALTVAGLITREKPHLVQQIYNESILPKREVILMKGHHIDYGAPIGTMVNLGGGIVKEVGYSNGCTVEQIASTITEKTAGILFVQSHHCVQKNMPSLPEVSTLAKEMDIPLIVDMAAGESLAANSELADVIILSGSKALEGPTSGVIAGKTKWIHAIRPHQYGIGRAMKIGKEAIFGILQALENYQKSSSLSEVEQIGRLQPIEAIETCEGVTVKLHQDEAGREIYRARIHLEKDVATLDARELSYQLKAGYPAIFMRDYYANMGFLDVDPRNINSKDAEEIAKEVITLLKGGRE